METETDEKKIKYKKQRIEAVQDALDAMDTDSDSDSDSEVEGIGSTSVAEFNKWGLGSLEDDDNLEKHQKEALEFSKKISSKEQEWLHLTGWWVGNVKCFEKVRKIKIINKRDILYDHLELIKQAINAENPLVCFGTQQEEGKGKATEGKNSGEKERKKTIEKEREEKKEKERKKRLELKSAGKKEEEGVTHFRQHYPKPFFTSDFKPNPAAAKKAYRAHVLE